MHDKLFGRDSDWLIAIMGALKLPVRSFSGGDVVYLEKSYMEVVE